MLCLAAPSSAHTHHPEHHPRTCVKRCPHPPRCPLLCPEKLYSRTPSVPSSPGSRSSTLHPPMSVATTNPFALLDGAFFFLLHSLSLSHPPADNPSPPSSPPPAPQPPLSSSNKPKPSRSGNYYPRGGARSAPKAPQQPQLDDSAPDTHRKCKSLSPSLSLPSLVTSRQPSQIPWLCSSWLCSPWWPPSL